MADLFELLVKGGIIMVPIGLASVLGLAVVLERIWALRELRIYPRGLLERVRETLLKKGTRAADQLVENDDSSLGRLLHAALERTHLPSTELRARVEERGRREAQIIGRHIETVGVLAAVSPLLGLLGTVTGMISVFRKVTMEAGVRGVNPSQLASGIWEALVTTAAGLSVGIPLYLAYRLLAGRADNVVAQLETDAQEFCDLLGEAPTRPEVET
ncbi:MotA/TolQ/ExbB proton channel family protein [Myxococcota bacterium]|nr:MotA/TolQ/ExbB proton channel family protein [Myxococcota bacterium]